MRRREFLQGITLASVVGGWSGGCQSNPAPGGADGSNGSRPTAVCTTGMVADLVRALAGDALNVTQLMGEGVDPHLYKASPGDIRALSSADLIVYSGLHLEGKMGDIFERMARKIPVHALAESLPEDRLILAGAAQHDPHVWFDVSLWSETIPGLVSALAKFDPSRAASFGEAASTYRARLAELHQECRARLATIPTERRVLVTAHDAFHYFGRAYKIEVRSIQGISTESEAGVRDINDLVSFIAEREIKAVFVESSVSDANLKALLEGCRARGHQVSIGGSLFSDAMGKPGTPEGTYPGMVRHNVNTIARALA